MKILSNIGYDEIVVKFLLVNEVLLFNKCDENKLLIANIFKKKTENYNS